MCQHAMTGSVLISSFVGWLQNIRQYSMICHCRSAAHIWLAMMCDGGHAGLASTALVLSIAAPFGGQNWYYLTLLSPLSGFYYWQRGTRQEEVQVLPFSHYPLALALMTYSYIRLSVQVSSASPGAAFATAGCL